MLCEGVRQVSSAHVARFISCAVCCCLPLAWLCFVCILAMISATTISLSAAWFSIGRDATRGLYSMHCVVDQSNARHLLCDKRHLLSHNLLLATGS